MSLIVLDTNVLVSAIRSRNGYSFDLISKVGGGKFDIAVSVPLVLEYEDALLRNLGNSLLTESDVGDLLDYLCSIAKPQEIYFLWRPLLKDPKDDLVAEVGIAAGCDAIVTFNKKDFGNVERLGVKILNPMEFLNFIGEIQ